VFALVFAGTVVVAADGIVMAIAGLVVLPRWAWVVSSLMGLAFALPAIAWSRPTWLVRTIGGPDPSAPVRYMLCWYRRQWPEFAASASSVQRFVYGLQRALGDLADPADTALIEFWSRQLNHVAHSAKLGNTSLKAAQDELAAALASVKPVDRFGAWLP